MPIWIPSPRKSGPKKPGGIHCPAFSSLRYGELAGFASCSDPARESVPVPEASEIVAFYLLRKFQGQGLAGVLMRHCLDFCTCPNVVLYVLEGNEKAAGFYRHMGFEPTGRIQLDHTPYGTLRDLEMVCRRKRKEN